MARTRQAARKATGGTPPRGQGESLRKRRRDQDSDLESESDPDSPTTVKKESEGGGGDTEEASDDIFEIPESEINNILRYMTQGTRHI